MTMSSTIALQFMRHHKGDIYATQYHNERQGGDKVVQHANEKIDPNRTDLNINLMPHSGDGKFPGGSYYKRATAVRDAYSTDTKWRKNAVILVEASVQFGGDFLKRPDSDFVKASKEAAQYIADVFGPQTVTSAVIHMDESNPHLHMDFVPINPDNGRVSWEHFSHGQKFLHGVQAGLLDHMQKEMPDADFKRKTKDEAIKSRRYHNGKNQKDFEALAEGWKAIDKQTAETEALGTALKELQEQLEAERAELEKERKALKQERAQFEAQKVAASIDLDKLTGTAAESIAKGINLDDLMKSHGHDMQQ